MFTVTSYFIQAVFPTLEGFKHPDAAAPEIAMYVSGTLFQIVFLAGGIAGTLSSGMSSHASVSRLLYVMGRDRILPQSFLVMFILSCVHLREILY